MVGDQEPGLVRLDDHEPVEFSRELWLLVHPELRQLARVRVVLDWLAAVVSAHDNK